MGIGELKRVNIDQWHGPVLGKTRTRWWCSLNQREASDKTRRLVGLVYFQVKAMIIVHQHFHNCIFISGEKPGTVRIVLVFLCNGFS